MRFFLVLLLPWCIDSHFKRWITSSLVCMTVNGVFLEESKVLLPRVVVAATLDEVDTSSSGELLKVKRGLLQLNYLLDNWKEKTTYCNIGEFQTELLLPENKEQLMKAAAETGLLDYDKSATMKIKCRQDPEMVRAYLGLKDNNNVLRNIEKILKQPIALQQVSEDEFDQYLENVEAYSQYLAEADALSYEARSDFLAVQTYSKEDLQDAQSNGKQDYLTRTQDSVMKLRDSLQNLVTELQL
jgi:hypothetical protein